MKTTNQKITIDSKTGRVRCQTVNESPSMTDQQWEKDCDVNNIMKRYQSTGEFVHRTSKQGIYADFSEITDYQTMLHKVQEAQDAFSSLPAQIRSRFRNDPGYLIDFLNDPKNLDEAVKLGLVETPKETQVYANESNEREKPDVTVKVPQKKQSASKEPAVTE